MDEYTINEDGEIVRGSNILSTERIIVLLNAYQRLMKNHDEICDVQKKLIENKDNIIDFQKQIKSIDDEIIDICKKHVKVNAQ